METIFDAEQDEAKELRKTDPLINWFRQKSDVSGRMLARIQNFAHSTSSKVKWSFLIEPGHPQTDLSVLIRVRVWIGIFENIFLHVN